MATPSLLRDRDRWWTLNLRPGERVYGEKVRRFKGKEYREWTARRSKLSAYLEKGGRPPEWRGDETLLYLGAASGTTVSHLSDLLPSGRIVAVEFSPRPFRDLLYLAAARSNIVPVLSDAHATDAYQAYLERPADVVVQDIAQRDQVAIFQRNVERFLADKGAAYLAVKARSINVAQNPKRVFDQVAKELSQAGLRVRETIGLEPFELDHAMIVVRR